jgi:hypothetical protein
MIDENGDGFIDQDEYENMFGAEAIKELAARTDLDQQQ